MILKAFLRGDGPETRDIQDLISRIKDEGFGVEIYDLDESESDSQRELYDIYAPPALVISQDDGKLVESWQGEVLPTESEIKNFMRL